MSRRLPAARGGHLLPSSFSSDARRRPRRRVVVGSIAAVALVAGLGATQAIASMGYDAARSEVDAAVGDVSAIADTVARDLSELREVTGAASLLTAQETGPLVEAAGRDALSSAVADAEELAVDVDALLAEASRIPSAGDKPTWFWELFAASDRLRVERANAGELADRLTAQHPDVDASRTTVTDAGIALLSAAAAAAGPFETAHVSARNDAIIALRDSAAAITPVTTLDEKAAAAYTALQDAAAEVVSTEQAELAEKDGPLRSARLEVESFARSLAPGVLLEFDWSPVVNGAGTGGSMGGRTTWWWDDPDRAVIELSDSVAERWPSDASTSLVAHEVGHAISVRCEDMYDTSTQDSIEKWATAWAISMGFTDDANGVWAYGYPPQSYIDAAAGCR